MIFLIKFYKNLNLPILGLFSSSFLLLALMSSSFSFVSKFLNLCWFCCWLIIAAMEKFVIFDNAAAVDSDELWFPISIFPFNSKFGGDAGSGELDGLAEDGFEGDVNV